MRWTGDMVTNALVTVVAEGATVRVCAAAADVAPVTVDAPCGVRIRPAGPCVWVDAQGVSAEEVVTVRMPSASSVRVETTTGAVLLGPWIDHAEARTVSGRVCVGAAQSSSVETDTGEVVIDEDHPGIVRVTSRAGAVTAHGWHGMALGVQTGGVVSVTAPEDAEDALGAVGITR